MLAAGSVQEALETLLRAVRAHVPRGDLGDDLAVVLLENLGVVQATDATPARGPGQT